MRIEKSTSKTGPLQGGPKPKEALKAGPKPQAAPAGITRDANRAQTGPLSVPTSADIGRLELPPKPGQGKRPTQGGTGNGDLGYTAAAAMLRPDESGEEPFEGVRPTQSGGGGAGDLGDGSGNPTRSSGRG